MSLHPGTATYNPAGNSDFTRKAEALALGITNWSTPKATDGAKGGPGQSYGSGGRPPLPAQAAQWQTPVADDQVDRLRGAYSTTCGHLFHAHVASHSMTCGHTREVICEAVSS